LGKTIIFAVVDKDADGIGGFFVGEDNVRTRFVIPQATGGEEEGFTSVPYFGQILKAR
jgi:hypothetical protein